MLGKPPASDTSMESESPLSSPTSHFAYICVVKIYFLEPENEQLKKKLANEENRMCFDNIKDIDSSVFQYTDLLTACHFEVLVVCLDLDQNNYSAKNSIDVYHVLHENQFIGMIDKITSRGKDKFFISACFAAFSDIRIVLECTEI